MRATFKNLNDQLIAGDYGKAIIYATKVDPTPTIPTKAIQENQEGKYVYVIDKNDIPKLVYVTVYGQNGDYSIIKAGLSIGDRIAVGGLQQIIPGSPVKIVSSDSELTHKKKDNFFIKVLRKIKHLVKGNK